MKFLPTNEATYLGIKVNRYLRKRRVYKYKATYSLVDYPKLLEVVKNYCMYSTEGDCLQLWAMSVTRIKQIITHINDHAIETSHTSER
jgi:hypothetical protein